MAYDARLKSGYGTTTTPNPRSINEHLRDKIMKASRFQTPMQELSKFFKKRGKPNHPRVDSQLMDVADPFDIFTFQAVSTDPTEARYVRVTISQPWNTSGDINYYLQDKVWLRSTNQTLECVVTPTSRIATPAGDLALTDAFIGNGTSKFTKTGEYIFRNIEQAPIIQWTNATDAISLGRTISESQDIGAVPYYQQTYFDYNLVEHKEAVIWINEDQLNLIKHKPGAFDWNAQQKEMIRQFKEKVELSYMFGRRALNFDKPNEPTRHMDGLMSHIKTNISFYNPDDANLNFEKMVRQFMLNQGFRFNLNDSQNSGSYKKTALVGRAFADKFAWYFSGMRRITEASKPVKLDVGLDIHSYTFQGFTIDLVIQDAFRLGTGMEHWCVLIDPMEAELYEVKSYNTRLYQLPTERKTKLMVEWQGTVAWNREEAYALLRTV